MKEEANNNSSTKQISLEIKDEISKEYHESINNWLDWGERYPGLDNLNPSCCFHFPIDTLIVSNFEIVEHNETESVLSKELIENWAIGDSEFISSGLSEFLYFNNVVQTGIITIPHNLNKPFIRNYFDCNKKIVVYPFCRFGKPIKILIDIPTKSWDLGYILWQTATTIYDIYSSPKKLTMVDGFWRHFSDLSFSYVNVYNDNTLFIGIDS